MGSSKEHHYSYKMIYRVILCAMTSLPWMAKAHLRRGGLQAGAPETWYVGMGNVERRVPVRIRLVSDSQQLCGWDVSQTWTRWASDTSKRRSLQPATVVNMSCVKTTQILEVNKCPKVQKTWYDRFAFPLHLSACLCFVQMLQSSKQLNDTKIADQSFLCIIDYGVVDSNPSTAFTLLEPELRNFWCWQRSWPLVFGTPMH